MSDNELKTCKAVCYNEAKIASMKASLPTAVELEALAAAYKVAGHRVRQAILHVLDTEECCVCDLANILEEPVSTISQHLKLLMSAGLLTSRRDSKLVFYALNRDLIDCNEDGVLAIKASGVRAVGVS